MTIAQRIRDRRLKQGIRQDDLAVLSGLTQSQISRYEAGVSSPAIPVLRVLAQALDTTIEYLLGSTEDQSPRTADLTPEETALVDAVRARDVARTFRILALIFEGDLNEDTTLR